MALTMYIVITSFFTSDIQIIRLGTSYCGHWMEKTHKIMNTSRNVYKCKATDTLHAHCTQGKKHNNVDLDVAMATLSVPGLLQFET